MGAVYNLNVGPTEVRIDEVTAGSELRFSFKLEYEDPNNAGTYLPYDLSNYTFDSAVKACGQEASTEVLQTFTITAPGTAGDGWVDCVLTNTQTTALADLLRGKCSFTFSIKMTPVSDAEASVTVLVGEFPVVRRATP